MRRLAALPPAEWETILPWSDRKRLTLQLFARLESFSLDPAVRQAFEERREKNRRRLARLRDEASRVLAILQGAGLRAMFLKGFTMAPSFVPCLEVRQQYDLDLYLSERDARRAHQLLQERGAYALDLDNEDRANHLPALVPRSGWEWRGDFFDLDIPISVELHYRLWNPEFERIRLQYAEPDGSATGQLACVVLHMMRHVFRGNVQPSHIYELAWFLEHHSEDADFWEQWRKTDPALQELGAAAFAIAARIFGARLPQVEIPRPVAAWVQRFATTALDQQHAGKCQALLQLVFVRGWRDRWTVLHRRLLPLHLPGPGPRAMRQTRYVAARAAYHVRSIFGFAAAAVLWLWDTR